MVGWESQREPPAAAHEHGRDVKVAVAKSFGPQLAVAPASAEGPEVLGPAAQVVAQADDEQPRPVGHEAVLAECVQAEVGLELRHPGLDDGLLSVLGLQHGGVGRVVVGDEDPVAVAALPQAGLAAGGISMRLTM